MPRRLVATAALTAAGVAFTATPTLAGGIVVVGSPSHDNSCANEHTTTQPRGTTSAGPGAANGLLGQLPTTSPLNHCGGADLPKPCIPILSKADVSIQDVVSVVNVGLQDLNVLNNPASATCTGNSVQVEEPLSDILEQAAALSENASDVEDS